MIIEDFYMIYVKTSHKYTLCSSGCLSSINNSTFNLKFSMIHKNNVNRICTQKLP